MKYRDAKKLQPGDKVVSKTTGAHYLVKNIEVYGSVKTVRVYVITDLDGEGCFFHNELELVDEKI